MNWIKKIFNKKAEKQCTIHTLLATGRFLNEN